MQFDGQMWSDWLAWIVGPADRVFPVYLALTLALCAAIHWRRRISGSLLAWLFPRSIYFHASHIVDVKLFLLNRVMGWFGVLQLVAVGALIASGVAHSFSFEANLAPFHPLWIAALLLLVADFGTYWVHRLHHENPIIWPFHALHHSAQVMTPLTVYRKHPIYDLISTLVKGVLIGILQGGFLVLFDQRPSVFVIAGANLFYVLFNALGANLRHSHIWLSYGPVLERILISPAQHQIHHSTAPEHHDKNYGEVLAIWDWMFGTLYVPKGHEVIEYGLADEEGRSLPQRHTSLASALLVPLSDSAQELARLVRPPLDGAANDQAAREKLSDG
ncbi:MAG: sterol desaturase family protein [Pseudomonadota bacterium]